VVYAECNRRGIYPSIEPELAEAEIRPRNFEAWKQIRSELGAEAEVLGQIIPGYAMDELLDRQ
jgi:hypothetical protein